MKILSTIETPFKDKFGVPRQSLLVEEAWGVMRFPKNNFYAEAFRGIEQFSHLWLIFEFHLVNNESFNGLVRPPRFDNKQKLGVYATRSPHRPNRLGLSVVKFIGLETLTDSLVLNVSGVDLVNGTPILDIKPYIPYVDSLPHAHAPMFSDPPELHSVTFSCHHKLSSAEEILITKVIALDPRPAHDKEDDQEFGVTLAGYNVLFKKILKGFEITQITKV